MRVRVCGVEMAVERDPEDGGVSQVLVGGVDIFPLIDDQPVLEHIVAAYGEASREHNRSLREADALVDAAS